jgi:hypothetical protein
MLETVASAQDRLVNLFSQPIFPGTPAPSVFHILHTACPWIWSEDRKSAKLYRALQQIRAMNIK